MMQNLYCKPRNEVDRCSWNSFSDSCNDAWLWHRYEFNDAMCTWPGKHDYSFAVYDESQSHSLVALVPLHLIDANAFRFFDIPFFDTMGGPCISNAIIGKHRRKLFFFIFDYIYSLASDLNVLSIECRLPALAPNYILQSSIVVNPLIHYGFENTIGQTWVVDLRGGSDVVWSSFETRARTAVRKAQQNEIHIRKASSNDYDLELYYNLHVETYHRTGVRPHPKEYFIEIWRSFLTNDLSKIYFAEYEGQVVSADNFAIYKNSALYWTGASSELGLKLQATSLIHWHAIQDMINEGLMFYEVGDAFPQAQSGKLKGLNDFKKSFGGSLYPVFKGRKVLRDKMQKCIDIYRNLRGLL